VLSYVAVAYVFDGATSDLVTCFKHSLSCCGMFSLVVF
jgi:hypothetical protein